MNVALVYLSGGGLSGGATTTLRRQVPLLRNHPGIDKLSVFLPPQSRNLDLPGTEIRSWPAGDRAKGFTKLRSQVEQLGPDVIFIPTGAWFDTGGIPCACMIRNTEPIIRPFGGNSLPQGIKNLFRARAARRACVNSDRVIAVSEFVRDLVVKRWRVAPDKIGVVYHGVQRPEHETRPGVPEVLERGNFWFTAGSLIPYRGIEDIITALSLRPTGEQLVIAGAPVYSPAYENKMRRLADRCGVTDRVTWLGHRPADELFWCYGRARAFVMTSRMEACPNVVLESLAGGCVSISTNAPPMPEFYEGTALYYTPGEVEELAAQMEAVINMNHDEVRSRRDTALSRATEFTWEGNVDDTVRELVAAAGRKGGQS
jgi:glycosyltransferase involved in cell wall biosynthesis